MEHLWYGMHVVEGGHAETLVISLNYQVCVHSIGAD
jgi:hypothetical protein